MNKKFLVAVTLYCVISVLGSASASITKDISLMPKVFRFQEEDYKVDEKFSEEHNVTIKQDFDGDGQPEVLIGFQGRTVDGEVPVSFVAIGHEEKGKFEYDIILSGIEYFFGVELADVDLDGLDEIIFSSGGGAHYNSLSIYKYKKGDVKVLFRNGSACGISIEGGKPFTIKVGREKWDEPGWCYAAGTDAFEVWKWDGKGFSYDSKLSTSKMVSEEQATDEYVKRVSSKLEEIGKGKISEQGQPHSGK